MASADVEIPKTFKACVYDKPGEISTKIVDMDMPEPGPAEVLINLTHSGVCHSDMGVMTNSWAPLPYPTQPGQVGGHEGIGKIVKMGPGAEAFNVKVGDRVGIKWISGICGSCPACLEGHDALCSSAKISGYYTPGTFQQYVLSPANYVTHIPDNLDSAAAAPMLCAGVTVYSGLKRSGAQPGQWVAIFGAGGGLGHIACQLGSRGMAFRIIGIDHGSKESVVRESGAEHFVDITKFDDKTLPEKVKELTGGMGVHAALVLTANNKAYAQVMDLLRFGGRCVCIGIPEGDSVPIAHAYPSTMIFKAQSIVGVAVGDRKEAIECLDFAARGIVKVHYRVEKMEKLTDTFKDMFDAKLVGRVVLDLS